MSGKNCSLLTGERMSLFQYVHKTWGTIKQTSCPRHQNVTWQTNEGFRVIVSPPDLSRRDVAPPGLPCVSSLSAVPQGDGQLWCEQTSLSRTV